jgi:hypothetical protein
MLNALMLQAYAGPRPMIDIEGGAPRGSSKPWHSRRQGSGLLVQALVAVLIGIAAAAGGQLQTSPAAGDRVEEILTKLQERSDGLKDIRCKVRYVEDDRINLSKHTKLGTILFLITEPNPHFLIHFDKTEADGVLGKQEWYLFDGLWLCETLERIKQVTKRQIARPGEKVDLFDLERAPFPLPFGQKKETILRNFDVTLAPQATADPPDTDHLVCIPKAESRLYRKYDKLEFFVRKDIHLPGRVVVVKSDGLEVSTADFPDLSAQSINAGVTKKDFALPDAWKKYDVVVEELAPDEKPAPWGGSRGD